MSLQTDFFKKKQTCLMISGLLSSVLFSGMTYAAASANFDSTTANLQIPAVDVPVSASRSETFNVTLKLVDAGNLTFELAGASPVSHSSADPVSFEPTVSKVFVPTVSVDNGSAKWFAELTLVPNSNPLRFVVTKLHSTQFSGCPSFATPAGGDACLLPGSITSDITLTNDITWVLAGGVDVGGDNTQSATLTIEPGTRIVGQSGPDFLYINRGSKIDAIGTPHHPIVFTSSTDNDTAGSATSGDWGGVVLSGNAPVNGCNSGVTVCEVINEALPTKTYGGNNASESSGNMKYVQIRYAGYEVSPDKELNALTLTGVGSGTVLDFIQLHQGSDDGIEMFGGTVNFKHVVSSENSDDSVDWGNGWAGKAQYVLIKQASDDGDNGIEADNHETDFNSLPRAKPILVNFTALGTNNTSVGANGALLRRGTGVNIHNSVFTGFRKSCLNIDSDATFTNAGTPSNLTGELTAVNTFVDCAVNFDDQANEPFLVSAWFSNQSGNQIANPHLNGYLPSANSPLLQTGSTTADGFIETTNYSGAFADQNDDWTQHWTHGLN
ncbi:MAG: hypothetical protein PHH11_01765 [Methylomonas sp.]|nr:hypothetical protein [Methylomonas sp.]